MIILYQDSDTNAAVAGALLGCKIGYNKLPQDWLTYAPHPIPFYLSSYFISSLSLYIYLYLLLCYFNRGLKEKDWLDEKVERFLGPRAELRYHFMVHK